VNTAQVARLLRFVREDPKGSNAGQGVEAFLKLTGLGPGHPWCAAFVAYVGHTLHGEQWPLPLTAACAVLGEAAKTKNIRYTQPEAGDIFLLYYPSLKRFAHTGFVLGPGKKKGTWATIEGNTGVDGSREGWGVFERERTFGANDRFIRTGL
jgi:hypothetical protein